MAFFDLTDTAFDVTYVENHTLTRITLERDADYHEALEIQIKSITKMDTTKTLEDVRSEAIARALEFLQKNSEAD